MKKKIAFMTTVIAISQSLAFSSFADKNTEVITNPNVLNANTNIEESKDKVQVMAEVSSQPLINMNNKKRCIGFEIDKKKYFKLRDIASMFSGTTSNFDIAWNDEKKIVEITTNKDYTKIEESEKVYYRGQMYSAKSFTSKMLIDGDLKELKGYNIDGSGYFKLEDLQAITSFDIDVLEDRNIGFVIQKTVEGSKRLKIGDKMTSTKLKDIFPRWKENINSYLIINEDMTFTTLEASSEEIILENFDKKGKQTSTKKIKNELPMFGAFLSGEKYNYIAFGDENKDENDEKEVIRIVKYDKKFEKISSISIKGGESYTINPFSAGCGRMSENGNELVFHTSRKRYTTDDGLNHQSQLTLIIDTSTMKVKNDLGRFQKNHVSHSFDQYVIFDGVNHVLLDHGDAYPRSIVLHKQSGTTYKEVDLFDIPGKIGANCTGVSIGGFESTKDNYIAAINSIDHSLVTEYNSYNMVGIEEEKRDIILCVVPKNDLKADKVKKVLISEYKNSNKKASIPKLVKISDEKLIVIWNEFDKGNDKLKYVFVDKNGEIIGQIKEKKGFVLSDMQPIVISDVVAWYTNFSHYGERGYRDIYTINIEE